MEQIRYKKNLVTTICLTFSILLSYALLVYVVDPLQQFRMAQFYHPIYINEIYQNPGLIKNDNYDTAIIGSSMAENFRASYIQNKLGYRTIKLSLSSANSFELSKTLRTVLNVGHVKNVLLCIDSFGFKGHSVRDGFPDYLYSSHSIIDSFYYLLNIGNLEFIFKILLSNIGFASQYNQNLDAAYNWNHRAVFSKQNVLQMWEHLQKQNAPFEKFSLDDMKHNFNMNLLGIIKKNPQVSFILIFTPDSVLAHKMYVKQNNLLTLLALQKYIFAQTKHLANVKIYDFQAASHITCHLDNYKDLSHYSEEINSFMIDNLKNKKYLVTQNNINDFCRSVLKHAQLPISAYA